LGAEIYLVFEEDFSIQICMTMVCVNMEQDEQANVELAWTSRDNLEDESNKASELVIDKEVVPNTKISRIIHFGNLYRVLELIVKEKKSYLDLIRLKLLITSLAIEVNIFIHIY